MSLSALSPDPLGAKGESRFQEICEDAGLTCNKATRDRTGWDFIVEFQFEPPGEVPSLDNRATPLSCHVQVKTLLTTGTERFKIRLSSAERLAKEIKPAFICVFRVDGLEFIEAYLIHIIDKPLERILKRLREAEVRRRGSPINKQSITFSAVSDGTRIEPTGAALRHAIQEMCGSSLHTYAARKAGQIRGLGYEPYPISGTFRFRSLTGLDEMVDVFLGLQRNVQIDHLEAFETRFGIPLPLRKFVPNTHLLSIDPHPADGCTVTIRNDGLGPPSVFDAELFVPAIPGLPMPHFKFLVRSPFFSMLIPTHGPLTYWHTEDIRSQKHSPECWVDLARLLVGLATGKANIEIRPNRLGDILWTMDEAITALDAASCSRWLEVCNITLWLFKASGISREKRISINEIDENGGDLIKAYAALNGKVTEYSFQTTRPQGVEIQTSTRAIMVDCAYIGDNIALTYYTVADLVLEADGDHLLWRSVKITPGQIRPVRVGREEFSRFVESATIEANVEVSLVLRSPEGILSAREAPGALPSQAEGAIGANEPPPI